MLTLIPSRADTIPEIVRRAKPAVVEIVALNEKGSPTKLGTGFFISADGLVVTNCHVIQGANSLAAFDNHGALFGLERILACSADPDLAVLKFRAHDVSFLEGTHSVPVEGDKIIVIGNPTGLAGTVSDGIVSGIRENGSIIQITAPISPGSSGSPVLDENGKVIGVVEGQREGQNLNFAIAHWQIYEILKSGYQEFQKQQAAIAKQQEEQKRHDEIEDYARAWNQRVDAGEKFLAENAHKPGVKTLPSGLQYKIIKKGTGRKPKHSDIVETNYRGTTIDGKEFDSSAMHGTRSSFPVNGLIKGWNEALKMMPVGSKWVLYIPSNLAWGGDDDIALPRRWNTWLPYYLRDDIAPGETLIFEVELLGIRRP
jgi:FKBP-type peptidyl-prolyl cis-trans isomerase